MSVSTRNTNTWNNSHECKLRERVAHALRHSSLSSSSPSNCSEHSELSEATTTNNTPISTTSISSFGAATEPSSLCGKDDQPSWDILNEAEAGSEPHEATNIDTPTLSTSIDSFSVQTEPSSLLGKDDPLGWQVLNVEGYGCEREDVSGPLSPYSSLASTSFQAVSCQPSADSDLQSSGQGFVRQDLSHHHSDTSSTKTVEVYHGHDVSNVPSCYSDVTKSAIPANPRRTSASKTWSKPSLVRQVARRQDFVMHLVGKSKYHSLLIPNSLVHTFSFLSESATQLVSHIWPEESKSSSTVWQQQDQIISLRYFIRETLRRSHSTHSTLQLTLYYLHLLKIKGNIPSCREWSARRTESSSRSMQCGRRMFLSALILASKYLQDRNYSAKAWSKITNLPVKEINVNERTFLKAVDYDLHLDVDKYNEWCANVSECVDAVSSGKTCPWIMVLEACKGISSSMMSSASSVMSALQVAPVVGASTSSSDLPFLSTTQEINAPLRTQPGRAASRHQRPKIYQGLGICSKDCHAKNNNNIITPPSSCGSGDELPFNSCEDSPPETSPTERSLPPAIQPTQLPTPQSAQDDPLDLNICNQTHPYYNTPHHTKSIESKVIARVEAVSRNHGLSTPPCSRPSSTTNSQDELPPMRNPAALAHNEHDIRLPAIAHLLCSGLKQGIKRGVEEGFDHFLQPVNQHFVTFDSPGPRSQYWVQQYQTSSVCGVKRSRSTACEEDSGKKSRMW